MYVDDFVYFSSSPEVEQEFERRLCRQTTVDFMGKVSHYLGLKFQWRETSSRTLVHISQEAFIDQLIESAGLDLTLSTTKQQLIAGVIQ